MSINYEDKLALGLPTDGDTSWGNITRQNFEVLGELASPDTCLFVSPHFTDAYLHNGSATAPRHFSTIQAALNAVTTTGNSMTTIFVYPGQYSENLTITKSVNIVGLVPPLYRAASGNGFGGCAAITGTNGTQSPTITITPPESNYIQVILNDLVLWNQYNAAAGQIANAYLLKLNAQTLYGALPNYVGIQGCDIRAQTWGAGNDWQHGMLISGWGSLTLRRTHMWAGSYAGGSNNGGMNSLITLNGNNANGKACTGRVIDCAMSLQYAGAYTSPACFKLDNLANITVAKSPLYRQTGAYVVQGATGTNTNAGIGTDLVNGTPATLASYGNLVGIDLASM